MRTEPCACGATLRFPLDEQTWARLMLAHVRTERHRLWRVRQGTYTGHWYEEHLPPVQRIRRRVA
jgi:hypothetical protein